MSSPENEGWYDQYRAADLSPLPQLVPRMDTETVRIYQQVAMDATPHYGTTAREVSPLAAICWRTVGRLMMQPRDRRSGPAVANQRSSRSYHSFITYWRATTREWVSQILRIDSSASSVKPLRG